MHAYIYSSHAGSIDSGPLWASLHLLQGAYPTNVTLPEPGTCVAYKGCSLGANRDIAVSTDVPGVNNITTTKPPRRGPYGVGDEIDVTVWFTEPVEVLANVTNAPRLRCRAHAYHILHSP